MTPSLLQEDRSVSQVVQRLRAFRTAGLEVFLARWWGVGGVSLAMAINKGFTSSPIQLSKTRGILRANRAPALVNQQLAVI
jgi:hypothetical protein